MSTVKHPRSVQAARVIEEDKKVLAEMLLVEIPPRRKGRTPAGVQTIEDELRETAAEILEGTGKQYDWGTLNDFRKVAAWVAGANWGVNTPISWADASWTAHLEAYKKGLSWADFVAGKRTKRAVRQQAGASTGDVPAAAKAINARPDEAAKLVGGLNKEAKAKLAAELNRTSTVRAALDDEQFLTKVVESMSPDQRRKVSREVNIQEHERLEERRRTEGGGRRVTRDPIGEKAIEVWRTNGEVIGKLHEAFRLLASVSSEWVTYAGKFRTDLAAQAILDIKAEVGVLCMYAGIPDEENGGIFTDFADPDSTPGS